MTSHDLKVALSRAFFEVRGTHIDGTEGNITSAEGLRHYIIVDPATSTFRRQVHRPTVPDDGKRIVAYSHQYSADSSQIVHSNANTVDGRKHRDIGVTDIFTREGYAEHKDGFPRVLGRSTWDENGTVETEQLYKPPEQTVVKEDTRTVAQRITEEAAMLPSAAAMRRFDEQMRPAAMVSVDYDIDGSG